MADFARRLPKWQVLQMLCQKFGMKIAYAKRVPKASEKVKSFVKIS